MEALGVYLSRYDRRVALYSETGTAFSGSTMGVKRAR